MTQPIPSSLLLVSSHISGSQCVIYLSTSVGRSQGQSDIETPADVMTQVNLHTIRSNFSILVSKASDQLEEKKVDLLKLQRHIITSFSITHEGSIAEFKAAGDVASLFDLLTKYGLLSYKNYHFLTVIIKTFIPDLHADMVDYQKDYAGYQFATNLEQHLADETDLVDPNPELVSCLKITVRVKLSDRALKYVEELWELLLVRFELPPYQLLLKRISGGSIDISWCFPQCETTRMVEVVKSSSQFFSDHSIIRVSINEQVFYELPFQQEVSRYPYITMLSWSISPISRQYMHIFHEHHLFLSDELLLKSYSLSLDCRKKDKSNQK